MIPVHQPVFTGLESSFVIDALQCGEVSGSVGEGSYLDRFERCFAQICDVRHGIATTSGTTALHLALAVLGIGPGHEVIIPAATNIATALAAVQLGAHVVPIDVEPETGNIDVTLVEKAITNRTRAIVPVHLYGHPVDHDPLADIARRYDLPIIEDAAEAHGAEYRGRRVGSLGKMACFSFYANKIITTGEGGMIVTNDDALADRARYLRNLAFGQPRFLHLERGFNYRMTNIQAAIGLGQLAGLEKTIKKKRGIAAIYTDRLEHVKGLQLPIEREWARNVYWMYTLVVKDDFPVSRDELMSHLADRGIESRTMFCSMNIQPALEGVMTIGECPVANDLWRRGMYIPSGCNLTGYDINAVCEVIEECAR